MKNRLNKILLKLFLMLFVIGTQLGCTKNNTTTCTPTPTSILGLWAGTAITSGGSTPQYFSIIVKADGTIISDTKTSSNLSSQYFSVGSWTLNGNLFTYSITNVYGNIPPSYIGQTQTGSATFSAETGNLTNGIWTNPSPFSSGTFSVSKVK